MSGGLRVGIVGYGLAGSVFHGPLVSATAGLEVAAVVTGDPARADRARRTHPGAVIHRSVDELLAAPGALDLLVVATPNRDHARIATAGLEAGLAVVVDKPIAPTAAEADALIETARRTGRLLTVFHNRRWDGDFLTVRRLVAGGLVGPAVRLESRFERFRPQVRAGAWRESAGPGEGAGLLFDLGVHLVDQAQVLFGPARTVYAEAAARRPGAAADDDSFVALGFAGGEVAHLWASSIPRRVGPRFRLVGLAGVYEKHGLDPQEEALRGGGRPGDPGWGREPAGAWGRLCTAAGGIERDGPLETEAGRYGEFYAAVREALLTGAPPPVDPAEAASAVRVIEAAHQSAAERAVIAL